MSNVVKNLHKRVSSRGNVNDAINIRSWFGSSDMSHILLTRTQKIGKLKESC